MAGKTEFSRRYVEEFFGEIFEEMKKNKEMINAAKRNKIDLSSFQRLFVRLDVDEIRDFLPQYNKTDVENGIKGNAHIIQPAANKGMDIFRDYCLKNSISFLQDGTFGNQYSTLEKLIKKSLGLGRRVEVFYIYIDPLIAWDFTKKREYLEGRNVRKDNFIEQFFKSMDNIDRIKEKFGSDIKIHCVLKDKDNEIEKVRFNESSSANFLKIEYSRGRIRKYNKEELMNLLG